MKRFVLVCILLFGIAVAQSISGIEIIKSVPGHPAMIQDSLMLPNYEILILGETKTLKQFDPVGNRLIHQYPLEKVEKIALSEDKTIFLALSRQQITGWDWKTGGKMFTVYTPQESINAMAYSEATALLAVNDDEIPVTLYDTRTGTRVKELDIEPQSVSVMQFTNKGSTIIIEQPFSESHDSVWLINVANERVLKKINVEAGEITDFALASDQQRLLVAGSRGVALVNLATGQQVRKYPKPVINSTRSDWIAASVQWDKAEKQFTLVNNIKYTAIYREDSSQPISVWATTHWSMNKAGWTANNQVMSISRDGHVITWKSPNEPQNDFIPSEGPVWELAVNPNGQNFLTVARDGIVRLWSNSGELLQMWATPEHRLYSIAWNPNGQQFVAVSDREYPDEADVLLFDVKQSQPVRIFKYKSDREKPYGVGVLDTAFSPDGKTLALAGDTPGLHLFDVESGQLLGTLKHQDSLFNVYFSPDGKRLITSQFKQVNVWQIESRRLEAVFQNMSYAVPLPNNLEFVAIEQKADQPIRFPYGEFRPTPLEPAPSNVTRVVISPDGQYMASGNGDNSISMWDLKTGKILFTKKITPKDDSDYYQFSNLYFQFRLDQKGLFIGGPADVGLLLTTFQTR